MKTVSTKLENKDFDRLMEMCNEEGECISESLRDMILGSLNAFDEWKENEKSKENSGPKQVPTVQIVEIDNDSVSEVKKS